jgi:hypothetical protein
MKGCVYRTWSCIFRCRLTTLFDKVDAIAVASLLLLQAKVSKIAEKSERQIAGVMKVSMGSQNVQKNKPADYQLSAAVIIG